MKPYEEILKQLLEQGIQFEIIQDNYNIHQDSHLSKVVKIWTDRFIETRTAPSLDNYLWHIFSFKSTECLEGKNAKDELEKQFEADTLIFNEQQQYLIKCIKRIPIIQMEDFFDDIYLSHYNMKWTYVIPHEIHSGMGPYFSYGNKLNSVQH